MPVSHAHRCIFVHIPKTGGTSIEKALGIFGDWRVEDRDIMFGQTAVPELNGKALSSPFLQHLTAVELEAMVTREVWAYLKFAIVRNPWEKMLSSYLNKDPHLVRVAGEQGFALEGSSLDDFIAMAGEIDHAHLRPQGDYILDEGGRPLVDVIGNTETLSRDFAAIGGTIGSHAVLPKANARDHGHYREYYSPHSRRLIENRYAADIEMFGYGF